MKEHKIIYRCDGRQNKKGCFESLASHAVWRVRKSFAKNYKLKESWKKGEKPKGSEKTKKTL